MILWKEDATNKDVWLDFALGNQNSMPIEDENLSQIQFIIKSHPYNMKSILDIGCGVGLYAKSWIDRGFSYTGIDQIPFAIEVAQKQNPKGKFETADIIEFNGNFDIVFSHTVLQHVHKNFKGLFLQKINDLLTNWGFFVCYEDVYKEPPQINIPYAYKVVKTHPYLYPKKEWIEKVESYGFFLYAECETCLLFMKVKT
ncbi:MAG: class I SAM-dependent methyltransferase [Candidatus Kariarchaeaceae archaeon]